MSSCIIPEGRTRETERVWGNTPSYQRDDLYIPSNWIQDSEGIQGYNLLLKGMPEVAVNWLNPMNAEHFEYVQAVRHS